MTMQRANPFVMVPLVVVTLALASCSDDEAVIVDAGSDITSEWEVFIQAGLVDEPTACAFELLFGLYPVLIESTEAGHVATWILNGECVSRDCTLSDNTLVCVDEISVDAGDQPGSSCSFSSPFTREYVDMFEFTSETEASVTLDRVVVDEEGAVQGSYEMTGSALRQDGSWPGCP